jgi:hypothetical protein
LSETIRIPAKEMNAYTYRGFSIIVFASGIAHVTHDDKTGEGKRPLRVECANPDEAVAWINLYMD